MSNNQLQPSAQKSFQPPSANDDQITRKLVTFHDQVIVHPHIHIDDMSEVEIALTWYDEDDLDLIKRDLLETIRMMAEGITFPEDDKFTSRGLEYRTPNGARMRQRNKNHSYDIVLEEQYCQWKRGICDEERLAKVYRDCADHSANVARLMALQDEHFVLDLDQALESPERSFPNPNGLKSSLKGTNVLATRILKASYSRKEASSHFTKQHHVDFAVLPIRRGNLGAGAA